MRHREWPPYTTARKNHWISDFAGAEYEVNVRRRIVDATYMRVTVPSMRPPPHEIAPEAACVPLNDLPKARKRHNHYTIVGAGKTGMDACLWLCVTASTQRT